MGFFGFTKMSIVIIPVFFFFPFSKKTFTTALSVLCYIVKVHKILFISIPCFCKTSFKLKQMCWETVHQYSTGLAWYLHSKINYYLREIQSKMIVGFLLQLKNKPQIVTVQISCTCFTFWMNYWPSLTASVLCFPRYRPVCLSAAEAERRSGEDRLEEPDSCSAGPVLLQQLHGSSLVPAQRQPWSWTWTP